MTKFQVQTGGKLYLAGEYAILTPGQLALIASIPIYMTAEISPAKTYDLSSDMFDYGVDLTPNQDYALIQETIKNANHYLESMGLATKPFRLSITGKLERQGKKLGIGSSGSVTILVLKAMAAFYQQDWSADFLFKLASYTLLKLGDNGSMGDLACIAYDDLVLYQSFDREKLSAWIAQEPMEVLLAKDWGYEIRIVHPSETQYFLVGWTGKPAISKDMINQVKSAISPAFLSDTKQAVELIVQALEAGDRKQLIQQVTRVSDLLEDLHPAIYTADLKRLVAASQGLDAVAKSSGSGGGDCGIALVFNPVDRQKLIERWQEAGIELISCQDLS